MTFYEQYRHICHLIEHAHDDIVLPQLPPANCEDFYVWNTPEELEAILAEMDAQEAQE